MATPRWLLAIPDAIRQLEQLEQQPLARRDVGRFFGVDEVRAAALMRTFGAELVGHQRTFPRTKLLQQRRPGRPLRASMPSSKVLVRLRSAGWSGLSLIRRLQNVE